ncbi:hypothetical protein V8G54_020191 [Vigna mungo]|uniref:Uncharacterized protein n=1 Tax=Vigna mungo TaxID=3915 RepID=A0AAQ3NBU3_VIGMU
MRLDESGKRVKKLCEPNAVLLSVAEAEGFINHKKLERVASPRGVHENQYIITEHIDGDDAWSHGDVLIEEKRREGYVVVEVKGFKVDGCFDNTGIPVSMATTTLSQIAVQ